MAKLIIENNSPRTVKLMRADRWLELDLADRLLDLHRGGKRLAQENLNRARNGVGRDSLALFIEPGAVTILDDDQDVRAGLLLREQLEALGCTVEVVY